MSVNYDLSNGKFWDSKLFIDSKYKPTSQDNENQNDDDMWYATHYMFCNYLTQDENTGLESGEKVSYKS